MKAASLAAVALIFTGCASKQFDAPTVEISELLANPSRYEGQLVRVRGAAVVRFEANFICPKPDLVDSDNSKRCLWLSPGEIGSAAYNLQLFHKKTVEIIGRFDPTHFGHMSAYGGTIFVRWGKVIGSHGKGDIPAPPPPPPPGSSANNSFKPNTLRVSA